jgi:ceramide glucosyltransferase
LPPRACAWKIAAPVLISILHFLAVISAIVTVVSVGYCAFCITVAVQFAGNRKAPPSAASLPPVSILKPLKGSDPELYEALRSHCLQDYPDFEILFGITEANGPAGEIVRELMQEFPARTRLVHAEKRLGANGKVSSLAQLAPLASHEILLVNDSDMRVEPDYLRRVVGQLEMPNIGLVTCLYRAIPASTVPSKLEALSISTDFVPGVLAARAIEGGLHFGLGSTLAFRKRELEAIGGLEAIVDYLADDYELGRRIAERNLRVELSECVVETHLPAYDFSGFFSHQLRWARTIRASRLLGYVGLSVTFTLPWAAATLLLAEGAAWAGGLAAAAIVVRSAMAVVFARFVLRDEHSLRCLWLLPVRDFLAPFIWLGGLIGRKILWRGESFTLKDGKLIPN